jgi:hypothetical protein
MIQVSYEGFRVEPLLKSNHLCKCQFPRDMPCLCIWPVWLISPRHRTSHGISWTCAFREGDDASIFFSGPVEAEERHPCPVSTGWLFWNIMAHHLLGKEGSASPPRWLWTVARIAVQEVGESPPNTRRSRPSLNDYPSLC